MVRKRVRLAQGLLVVAVTAGLIVGTVYLLQEVDGPPAVPGGADDSSAVAKQDGAKLRAELLAGSAEKAGITPVRGVWGVLMERGYTKGVATFVALADGAASMYVSASGAAVSGKAYAPARAAARKLCEQAADSLADTIPADKFPPPGQGRVRFYVLTTSGVKMAEGAAVPVHAEAGRDAFGRLLAAGDEVVGALQDATSKGIVR